MKLKYQILEQLKKNYALLNALTVFLFFIMVGMVVIIVQLTNLNMTLHNDVASELEKQTELYRDIMEDATGKRY